MVQDTRAPNRVSDRGYQQPAQLITLTPRYPRQSCLHVWAPPLKYTAWVPFHSMFFLLATAIAKLRLLQKNCLGGVLCLIVCSSVSSVKTKMRCQKHVKQRWVLGRGYLSCRPQNPKIPLPVDVIGRRLYSSFPTKLSHQHCKLADVALSSLEPRCCRSPAPISLPQMFWLGYLWLEYFSANKAKPMLHAPRFFLVFLWYM